MPAATVLNPIASGTFTSASLLRSPGPPYTRTSTTPADTSPLVTAGSTSHGHQAATVAPCDLVFTGSFWDRDRHGNGLSGVCRQRGAEADRDHPDQQQEE